MPLFIDFHPGYKAKPESIERLAAKTKSGEVDEFGVRQVEFYYGEDGAYCVLEAPDKEAVRKHHGGKCGEIHEVKGLS